MPFPRFFPPHPLFPNDRMKRTVRRLLAAAILAAASATPFGCTGDNTYSTYPCRFVFDTAQHASSGALLSAVNPLSPGIFCKVSKVMKGGASYYRFATTEGLTDDIIFTAVDQRTTVTLGMNNGLVFGYANLAATTTFYGYDTECPNCFDPDAVPVTAHTLAIRNTGIAVCPTCHREYNLNTGGNITKGDQGKGLTRYRAAYNGSVISIV